MESLLFLVGNPLLHKEKYYNGKRRELNKEYGGAGVEQGFVLNAERGEIYSLSHGICLTAKVYGDIGCENFKRALNKMLKRYPILGSSLSLETDGERSLMQNQDKELEPVYYPYGEVNYIEKHIEKEERIPYDLINGPLFKTMVFKGEERSVIALMASPVIADVMSLKIALETIVFCLNHENGDVKEKPLGRAVGKEEVKEERLLTLKDWLTIKRVNHEWKKQRRVFGWEEYLTQYAAYHKAHVTPILIKEIRSRSTEALLANCKNKGVTLDAALLMAFVAVVNSFDRGHFGREIPIHYSVDLRKEISLADPLRMGRLSGTISFKKSYVLQQSFWDNVKEMNDRLNNKCISRRQCLREFMICLKVDGSLLESLPFLEENGYDSAAAKKTVELLGQGEKDRGIYLYTMNETNYRAEDKFYIDTLNVIPPASEYNELTIGSCVVNGRLRLCIRYDKSHYSEHILEEMVRTAVNYMWNRTEN